MSRRCPICGRGMFRYKQLIEHIKHYHPHYYQDHVANSPRYSICHALMIARRKGKDVRIPPECYQ